MLPLLLETENFQSHGKCVLDFTRLDKISLIVGEYDDAPSKSNGAGKSSLFDAIDWALFDQSRVSGTKTLTNDDLVRDGQTQMSVRFTFIGRDNNTYRVTKTFKKRKYQSPVAIQVEIKEGEKWKAYDKDGNRETKKRIISILGFEGDIWSNTALCKQHEVAGIAKEDSTQRLALIKKLLRQDKYAKYAAVAKKKRDELVKQLDEQSEVLEQAKEAKARIEEHKKELDKIAARRKVQQSKIDTQKEKMEKLREEIATLNKIIGAAEQLQSSLNNNHERREALIKDSAELKDRQKQSLEELEKLKAEFKEKTERQRAIDNNKPDKTKLINEYRAAHKEQGELQTKKGSLEGMLESTLEQGRSLRQELDSFKELGTGACPTCKNDITCDHSEKVIADYEEKLTKLRAKAKETKKQVAETEKELKRVQERIEELEQAKERYNQLIEERNSIIERLKSINELVQAKQSSSDHVNNQLQVNTTELTKLQKEVEKLEKQLETAGGEKVTTKHKGLADLLKENNEKLEDLQRQDTQLNADANRLKAEIKTAEDVVEQAKAVKKGTRDLRNRIQIYETLLVDFQKTIPTMILENSAGMIESEVNRCLATLSDGFSIAINTQHKNKTNNKIKEVFDIQVTVGDKVRAFELLSGGEQFRVAFAIRVALSIILAQESGVQIGAIFYDEPFNDLDQDGLDKIQEIFVSLSGVFQHQLAITHQNRLKEIFNDVITVRKGKEGSYIELAV